MATGNYDLGGSAPTFSMVEILLYRLQITVSDDWACAYISGSGSYTSYASIGAFITALQYGTLTAPDGPLPTFGPGDSAPDIIVVNPCYVVVVLTSPDQSSLCFQQKAITTGTNCATKYYGLTETSAGSIAPKPTVAYFAVPVVQQTSQHVNDPYTLFVQYTANGSTITHSIDPMVKNHGPNG